MRFLIHSLACFAAALPVNHVYTFHSSAKSHATLNLGNVKDFRISTKASSKFSSTLNGLEYNGDASVQSQGLPVDASIQTFAETNADFGKKKNFYDKNPDDVYVESHANASTEIKNGQVTDVSSEGKTDVIANELQLPIRVENDADSTVSDSLSSPDELEDKPPKGTLVLKSRASTSLRIGGDTETNSSAREPQSQLLLEDTIQPSRDNSDIRQSSRVEPSTDPSHEPQPTSTEAVVPELVISEPTREVESFIANSENTHTDATHEENTFMQSVLAHEPDSLPPNVLHGRSAKPQPTVLGLPVRRVRGPKKRNRARTSRVKDLLDAEPTLGPTYSKPDAKLETRLESTSLANNPGSPTNSPQPFTSHPVDDFQSLPATSVSSIPRRKKTFSWNVKSAPSFVGLPRVLASKHKASTSTPKKQVKFNTSKGNTDLTLPITIYPLSTDEVPPVTSKVDNTTVESVIVPRNQSFSQELSFPHHIPTNAATNVSVNTNGNIEVEALSESNLPGAVSLTATSSADVKIDALASTMETSVHAQNATSFVEQTPQQISANSSLTVGLNLATQAISSVTVNSSLLTNPTNISQSKITATSSADVNPSLPTRAVPGRNRAKNVLRQQKLAAARTQLGSSLYLNTKASSQVKFESPQRNETASVSKNLVSPDTFATQVISTKAGVKIEFGLTTSAVKVDANVTVTTAPVSTIPQKQITTTSASGKIQTLPPLESSLLSFPKSLATAKQTGRAKTILRQYLSTTTQAVSTRVEAKAQTKVEALGPSYLLKSSSVSTFSPLFSGHALKTQRIPESTIKSTASSDTSNPVPENGQLPVKATSVSTSGIKSSSKGLPLITATSSASVDFGPNLQTVPFSPESHPPKTLKSVTFADTDKVLSFDDEDEVEPPLLAVSRALATVNYQPSKKEDFATRRVLDTVTKSSAHSMLTANVEPRVLEATAKSMSTSSLFSSISPPGELEEKKFSEIRTAAVSKSRLHFGTRVAPTLQSSEESTDMGIHTIFNKPVTTVGSPSQKDEEFKDLSVTVTVPTPTILPQSLSSVSAPSVVSQNHSSSLPSSPVQVDNSKQTPVSSTLSSMNASRPLPVSLNETVTSTQKGPNLPLWTSGSGKGQKSSIFKIYFPVSLAAVFVFL